MESDACNEQDRIVPCDDGLELPEVGPWARRKYHFLSRFLNQFTKAMRLKYDALYFIDLYAAAGFARIRGTDEVVATSSVIAANADFLFSRLIACDTNESNLSALHERLSRRAQPRSPLLLHGDANSKVHEIVSAVSGRRSLSVTFADPFNLGALKFDTVRAISKLKSDLIILLPDGMDAVRNMAAYYLCNPNSSLDEFMGEPGWRELVASPVGDTHEKLRLRYENRLRGLGYKHFGMTRFNTPIGQRMYCLVFASRHPLGLKFWENANSLDEGGQRSLFKPS